MTSMTTSSCLCGAIKLSFSLDAEQVVAKFLCHCTDDRKITGSMFATNLILKDATLTQLPTDSSSYTPSLPPNAPPLAHSPIPTTPSHAPAPAAAPAGSPSTAEPQLSSYTLAALSGHTMTSHFCAQCGTTLYRTSSGFPGMVVIKIGTVDDVQLVEEVLRPETEQFAGRRVGWLRAAEGVVRQEVGNYFC